MNQAEIKKQKGFSATSILIGVLVIAGLVGGSYYFGVVKNTKPQPQNPILASAAPSSSPSDETITWKTYTSKNCNFSLKYPDSWETYSYGLAPQDEPTDYCSPTLAEERFFRPVGTKVPALSLKVTPNKDISYSAELKYIKGLYDDKRKIIDVPVAGGIGTEVTGQVKGENQAVGLFQNKDYTFEINSATNEGTQNFNLILSTFKFTKPTPNPTATREQWQKYEGGAQIAGLSFQYPQGWTVNYRREYNLSSGYTAKYRLSFDFAPPGWKNQESLDNNWLGWGGTSFDVYDPQTDINQWLSKYETGIYKDKLVAKEQTKIGNKSTFLVSVNPQYSKEIEWRSRIVILGEDYSYELTTSEGYFKSPTDNFRTVLEEKIYPGIKIN